MIVLRHKSARAAPPWNLWPTVRSGAWRNPACRWTLVGRLLVHYKLGKHGTIRISNSIGSQTDIVKFLKKHKAVLMRGTKPAAAKPPVAVKKTVAVKKNGASKKLVAP